MRNTYVEHIPRFLPGGNRSVLSAFGDYVSGRDILWSGPILSTLRIVAGFLFLAHGLQKLVSFPAAMPGPAIPLWSLIGAAGILEVVGGTLIIAGFLTRPVALILSGEMAFAYFMQHAPNGFWPLNNGGELAALYAFVFLYLASVGAGPWSLDSMIWPSHARRTESSARSSNPVF